MLQQAATAANFGVCMMPALPDAATLRRGLDASSAATIHAYKGRPRPPEPAKAPAPAPKDGAAPAPKPAEKPEGGKKDAEKDAK